MRPAWSVELVLDAKQVLSANSSHDHWSRQSSKTRQLRRLGHDHAVARRAPRLERATVLCEIEFPDRRRRDTDNLSPTTKALIDGFIDAGLLPDDNRYRLEGPHKIASPRLSKRVLGQPTFTLRFDFYEVGSIKELINV